MASDFGAFAGLDNIIQQRIGVKTLGFGADVKKKIEKKSGELLRDVTSRIVAMSFCEPRSW